MNAPITGPYSANFNAMQLPETRGSKPMRRPRLPSPTPPKSPTVNRFGVSSGLSPYRSFRAKM